ncbi:MAG TPA: FadR/GntR family transcriptional regulator [Vicinamibacterales bacterium]|jgi:DNA-binding FadR family transcriptional regulator|nr:FadR/GntR family transcriptional regulator [Vicinamibacterales bacterium]
MTPRPSASVTAVRPRAPRKIAVRAMSTKGTTADRVVSVLVDHIRRHRLPAGASLPSELQTSSQLRVSRSVVREAYRSLSSAGLVEIANGRSPRVGQITNRSLIQLVQHALSTRQASAAQILELRGPIEEYAAELAARHRTAEDVKELRAAVAALRTAVTPVVKTDAYIKADLRFHEIIGRATNNPMFSVVVSALRYSMGESIRVSLAGRRSRAELQRVIRTHGRIVDAIEAGRAREARRLMAKHFAEARISVRRMTADE